MEKSDEMGITLSKVHRLGRRAARDILAIDFKIYAVNEIVLPLTTMIELHVNCSVLSIDIERWMSPFRICGNEITLKICELLASHSKHGK